MSTGRTIVHTGTQNCSFNSFVVKMLLNTSGGGAVHSQCDGIATDDHPRPKNEVLSLGKIASFGMRLVRPNDTWPLYIQMLNVGSR
jgi:hypothetical protein